MIYDAYFFILISGRAVVTRKDVTRPIAFLEPGDFFGALSFLIRRARTASVTAEEDSLIMRVDHAILKKLDPAVREKLKDRIIEKLMDRICRTNEMLKEIPS
jgi:CRP/FNR family transcriptional regulator, cyclic AMP receptor protein